MHTTPHCVAEQPEAHRVQGLAEVHVGSGVTELGSELRTNSLASGPNQSRRLFPIHGFPEKILD